MARVFIPGVHAQTNFGLNLQLYAGLSVTGTVGQVYQVQYATGLEATNTWYALMHFELKWNPYAFVDTTCPATERRFYRAVEVDVPTNVVPVANMVFIPPGTFIMGSPPDEPGRFPDEGPQTEVTISHGFWMGKYEVTQGEYVSMIGRNPSAARNGTTGAPFGGTGVAITNELLHPVEMVSWFDAKNYCEQLTAQERAAGRLPEGYVYRLPTEAEWEYACRAGTTTPYHYGAALRSGMANFRGYQEYPPCGEDETFCYNPAGVFLGRSAEVGQYEPNAWGLYDMHANLYEWCQDWWARRLPGGKVTDPQGAPSGTGRVIRSGRWYFGARYARSACRLNYGTPASWLSDDVGFRVVLAPVPSR